LTYYLKGNEIVRLFNAKFSPMTICYFSPIKEEMPIIDKGREMGLRPAKIGAPMPPI